MSNPRRTLAPVLEIAALALVLLDVGLGFSAAWIKSRVEARQEVLASTERHVLEEQARVASLEKFQGSLPGAEGELKLFTSDRLPPRRQAYARAAHLVRVLADKAGVRLTAVGFKVDSKQETPVERLGLELGVEGQFPALIDFSRGLETGSEFVVVRNFTFTPAESGKLALRLGADLYMTP